MEKRTRRRRRSLWPLYIIITLALIAAAAIYLYKNTDIAYFLSAPQQFERESIVFAAEQAAGKGENQFHLLYSAEELNDADFSEELKDILSSRYSLSGIQGFSWGSKELFNRKLYIVNIEYSTTPPQLSENPEPYSRAGLEAALVSALYSGREKASFIFKNPGGITSEVVKEEFQSILYGCAEYSYLAERCQHTDSAYEDYISIDVEFDYAEGRNPLAEIFETTDPEQAWRYFRSELETGLETAVIISDEAQIDTELMDSIFISAYYNDCWDISSQCGNIIHGIYKGDEGRYLITYKLDFEAAADHEKIIAEAKTKLASIELEPGSPKELYRAIFDYILKNCEYDTELRDDILEEIESYAVLHYRGSYGALVRGKSVCSGYASAFKALCDKYALPCLVVTGSIDGVAHVWNAVILDGKIFYVDTTFADTSSEPDRYFLMDEAAYRSTGYIEDEKQFIPQTFKK